VSDYLEIPWEGKKYRVDRETAEREGIVQLSDTLFVQYDYVDDEGNLVELQECPIPRAELIEE